MSITRLRGFEEIHRSAKDEQRIEWENLVFEPFETDQIAIKNYLQSLFGKGGANKQAMKALDALEKSVDAFETTLAAPGQFNDHVLRWTINGLLVSSISASTLINHIDFIQAAGLLSEQKCAVLKDFLSSPVILVEVADVLNMRMADFQSWNWETSVSIEQRRHVTGEYHMYIDEDLLHGIFLQYIGVKWSVFFKEAFTKFLKFDGAWTSLRKPISKIDKKRREYFLGSQQEKPSVQSKRQSLYNSVFFMHLLPDSPYSDQQTIEGEEEVGFAAHRSGRTAQTAPNSSYPSQMMQTPQTAPRRQVAS